MGCSTSRPMVDQTTHNVVYRQGGMNVKKKKPSTKITSKSAKEEGEIDKTKCFFGLNVDYNMISFNKSIGVGTFGEVFDCNIGGHRVAVKQLSVHSKRNRFEYDMAVSDFRREACLLVPMRHKNIVQFLGAVNRDPNFCLIFELLEGSVGSLLQMVKKKKIQLTWNICLNIAKDAACAVQYLHGLTPRVIHRDLKAENLLLTADFRCKLTDFGLSRSFSGMSSAMTVCGTPCWVAPEMFRNEPYSEKVDTYSFGVVLWELFTGDKPHGNVDAAELPYLVCRKGLRPPLLTNCPRSVNDLMKSCWRDSSLSRPSFSVILDKLNAIEEELQNTRQLGDPVHEPKPIRKVKDVFPLQEIPQNINRQLPTTKRNPNSVMVA